MDPYNGLTVGDLRVVNSFTAGDLASIDWDEVRATLADIGQLTPEVAAAIDFVEAQDAPFFQLGIDEINRIIATYPDDTLLSDVFAPGNPTEPEPPGGDGAVVGLDPLDLPDTPPPTASLWRSSGGTPLFSSNGDGGGQITSPLIEFDAGADQWVIGDDDAWLDDPDWLSSAGGNVREIVGRSVGALWDSATGFLDDLGSRFGIVELGQQIDRARDLYDNITSLHTNIFTNIDAVMNNRITIQEYDEAIFGSVDEFLDRASEQVDEPFEPVVQSFRYGISYSNSFNLVLSTEDGLVGLDTPDALMGGALADTLTGRGGDDLLSGGGGDDMLDAGAGDDLAAGGGGADSLDAGTGLDRAWGQAGNDSIDGGDGADNLFGNLGNDSIDGGSGNDLVRAQPGDDALSGGAGDDELFGGADADSLLGGDGNDTLNGSSGFDTLGGGGGADLLRGQGGQDSLGGDAGDDSLLGMAGLDRLDGGDGNDTLTGGDADDTLTGGSGSDLFVFAPGQGSDLVTDFTFDVDRLSIAGAASFAALDIVATAAGTQITLTADGGAPTLVVTLAGIDASLMIPADFVFG